jgi:hypothetical protein
MERKKGIKKLNLRKSLMCTLLIVLTFSAMTTSMAFARETPTQAPPDNTSVAPEENPTLIATQDNSTMALNDTLILDRTQDSNSTTSNDNATLYSAQDTQTEDNPPLITTQAQPDNTATILGVAALVAAIAIAAIIVVLQRHQKVAVQQ